MKETNTRTGTLKKYIDGNIRLSDNDREFLRDLARVGIIDAADAKKFHYQETRTNADRRLDKLCEAGLLEKVDVNQPGRGKFKAYQFKTDRIATLFGGKKPTIGRKRNALHEVITSKLFFAEGRPNTFVVEANFTKKERELFALSSPSATGRNSSIPDAMYVRPDGQIVVLEADSGQYNQTQIRSKQEAWSGAGFSQVWGQPTMAASKVDNALVYRF
jgi:hypothetical protein